MDLINHALLEEDQAEAQKILILKGFIFQKLQAHKKNKGKRRKID